MEKYKVAEPMMDESETEYLQMEEPDESSTAADDDE
jgi:hypothetical protein